MEAETDCDHSIVFVVLQPYEPPIFNGPMPIPRDTLTLHASEMDTDPVIVSCSVKFELGSQFATGVPTNRSYVVLDKACLGSKKKNISIC